MTPSRLLLQSINRASHSEAITFEMQLRAAILERVQLALDEGEAEHAVLMKISSYARTLARAGGGAE